MAARSHSSKSERSHGFSMSDENKTSPKFPSNSSGQQKTSNDAKSLTTSEKHQQLFYSDVKGYIPAAGVGIANQEFERDFSPVKKAMSFSSEVHDCLKNSKR